MLGIPRSIYTALLDQARAALPLEACGILAGNDPTVTRHFPMTNADQSPVHFSLVPEEQFSVAKAIRADGLRMLAIYHSHPKTPARLSQQDLDQAYTSEVVYLIISLAQSEPVVKGFTVDQGQATEIHLQIIDED